MTYQPPFTMKLAKDIRIGDSIWYWDGSICEVEAITNHDRDGGKTFTHTDSSVDTWDDTEELRVVTAKIDDTPAKGQAALPTGLLARIRFDYHFALKAKDTAFWLTDVGNLLSHVDALTADLATLKAENAALRATIRNKNSVLEAYRIEHEQREEDVDFSKWVDEHTAKPTPPPSIETPAASTFVGSVLDNVYSIDTPTLDSSMLAKPSEPPAPVARPAVKLTKGERQLLSQIDSFECTSIPLSAYDLERGQKAILNRLSDKKLVKRTLINNRTGLGLTDAGRAALSATERKP